MSARRGEPGRDPEEPSGPGDVPSAVDDSGTIAGEQARHVDDEG